MLLNTTTQQPMGEKRSDTRRRHRHSDRVRHGVAVLVSDRLRTVGRHPAVRRREPVLCAAHQPAEGAVAVAAAAAVPREGLSAWRLREKVSI